MNLICRDLLYNKICSSILIPNKIRRVFYKMGGYK